MNMDCRSLLDRLDALLDGSLHPDARRACEEHLRECADCRHLVELARSEPGDAPAGPTLDLVRPVIERTSGPACGSARDLLGDFIDRSLPKLDTDLVRLHLDGCEACKGLARTLTRLARDLPAMAEIEPDAAFVDDVLARTIPWRKRRGRSGRHLDRPGASRGLQTILDLGSRIAARPRFALEAAYVGTLVLVLIFGPNLPLAGVSKATIGMIEPGEARGGIADVEGRIAFGARGLWNATGGEIAARSRSVAAGLAQRYESTGGARAELRRHGIGLFDAALDADPGAAATAVRGIGSGLGTLWTRIASNETDERDNPGR